MEIMNKNVIKLKMALTVKDSGCYVMNGESGSDDGECEQR